jgi:uncharacterized membrane-anchored protein
MPLLPPNHPERFILAEEVHARPPILIPSPAQATYVALLVAPEDREKELAHLRSLCEMFAAPSPTGNATHLSATLGGVRLKWERHGEFSGYTFVASGDGVKADSFADTATQLLPENWLSNIPGKTIAAAHMLLRKSDPSSNASVDQTVWFGSNMIVGALISGGDATVFTDFKIHNDGFARFVLLDNDLKPRQAGQTMQRLFEVEAYRNLALLALPIARRQSPRILSIEQSLAVLIDGIAKDDGDDEKLLHELTRLAAEVESGLAASQFRFGACRAYFELVTTRISELREVRLPGVQTIEEFMSRRFKPAVATCTTVSHRLRDLSERVAQTSALLSTRVNIARERQNQQLLSSMDRRAKLQLRLQQTVEGLSIAAIVYYIVGLLAYLLKALKAGGANINVDVLIGVSIPILLAVVIVGVRKVREKIAGSPGVEELGASAINKK